MFQLFCAFLIRQLVVIHCGVSSAKIKACFIIGSALSPAAYLFEKCTHWYVTNQAYIYWVCFAILCDWIIGLIKHLKHRTFSWSNMAIGILLKLGMAIIAGLLFEGLPYFLKENNFVSDSLMLILRLSVFMYPAGSCWMNMSVITNGVFPPTAWIEKVKSFNQNLNLQNFKNDKSESN